MALMVAGAILLSASVQARPNEDGADTSAMPAGASCRPPGSLKEVAHGR
jgi:hypothetical protein